MFGITITLDRDFRGRTVDSAQVVWCEFDCERTIVLVEARQLGRARDRNNPRLLRKQPRQRDLRWCRLLLCPNGTAAVNKTTVVSGGGMPHGYIAVLPGGYRAATISGVRYYSVGSIYYRPQIYQGRTVYVAVRL